MTATRWLRVDEAPLVQAFFARNLRADSILATSTPFLRWMCYEAPGWKDPAHLSIAGVFDGETLCGVLACKVVLRDGRTLAWLTNWLVAPGANVGLELLAFVRAHGFDDLAALGVNDTAAALYRALKWPALPGSRRFWITRPTARIEALPSAEMTDPFLRWRYADHPVFTYHTASRDNNLLIWREVVSPAGPIARVTHWTGDPAATVTAPFADSAVIGLDFVTTDESFPLVSAAPPPELTASDALVPLFRGFRAPGRSLSPPSPFTAGDADRDRPR